MRDAAGRARTPVNYIAIPALARAAAEGPHRTERPPADPAVEGGFTVVDFIVDHAAGTATCPVGITRQVSSKCNVTYGIACRDCPFAARCANSVWGRKLTIGEHDLLQREHRQRANDEGFQAVYRQHRPMVERSIAWLTRGARRVPYHGVEKNNNWLHHRVAALNLRRLLALGLTVHDGAWVPA